MRMDYERSMGLLSKLAELIAARATATLSVRDEMLSQLLPFQLDSTTSLISEANSYSNYKRQTAGKLPCPSVPWPQCFGWARSGEPGAFGFQVNSTSCWREQIPQASSSSSCINAPWRQASTPIAEKSPGSKYNACSNLWPPLFVALLPASSNVPNKPVDRISKSSSSHTSKAHCNCLNLSTSHKHLANFTNPSTIYTWRPLPPPFSALSMWLDGISRCLIHKRGCVGDHQHTTSKDLRKQQRTRSTLPKSACGGNSNIGNTWKYWNTLSAIVSQMQRKEYFWHLSFVSATLVQKELGTKAI